MAGRGYTIGQAACAAGVGVETIRFYERKGLIEQPPRPPVGARRYPQATVARVRALRQGQELGFPLAEIDALLALRADPGADCSQVRKRAKVHLDEIERRRTRLGEVADKLRELIAACPGQGATHACVILDALNAPGLQPLADESDAGETQRLELAVDGMECGACAATVRRLLCNVPGVRDAAVDRVSGTARVQIDPTITDVAALIASLGEAGFSASRR